VICLAFAVVLAADPNGCTGQTNTFPLVDSPPTLVK